MDAEKPLFLKYTHTEKPLFLKYTHAEKPLGGFKLCGKTTGRINP